MPSKAPAKITIKLRTTTTTFDMNKNPAPMIAKICQRYNGTQFFEATIKRTDLMKYDVRDVIAKVRFIRDVIGSILEDM